MSIQYRNFCANFAVAMCVGKGINAGQVVDVMWTSTLVYFGGKMAGYISFFENDNGGLCSKHGWVGYADSNGDYWCAECGWVGNMFTTGDYYGEVHSRDDYYDDGSIAESFDDDH